MTYAEVPHLVGAFWHSPLVVHNFLRKETRFLGETGFLGLHGFSLVINKNKGLQSLVAIALFGYKSYLYQDLRKGSIYSALVRYADANTPYQ